MRTTNVKTKIKMRGPVMLGFRGEKLAWKLQELLALARRSSDTTCSKAVLHKAKKS